ncbi:MAG: helix-turn-helix transcriptional regulator [Spirochaetaceae bacterium]|nr:helix-turn-helix transcriptional regulator [Spirochaetaceae bacterium]
MPSKEIVRQRIKEIRKQKGITQEQLAEKLGMTQSAVSAIESSSNSITIETINKVSAALGVTAVDLLIDLDHISADADLLEKMGFEWGDLRILEEFQKLNEDGQSEAIRRTHEMTLIDFYRK